MKLFSENGYVDIRSILADDERYTFVWIIGGRATGKTYTFLKTVIEDDMRFIYMRRRQTQVDLIKTPEFNPFKKLNKNEGWNIVPAPITKNHSGFYNGKMDKDGIIRPEGSPLGYAMALSTISGLRGFDASDVEIWCYDEFIPEMNERAIANEGSAFLNAYETINRNRELEGEKALRFIGLSNSNTAANDIFLYLHLTEVVERMKKRGQRVWQNLDRRTMIIDLGDSEISEQKRDTALYKMAQGTDFIGMSLDNEFIDDDFSNINSMPLVEYIPKVAIGEICIYKHKSRSEYYVSSTITGSPRRIDDTEAGKLLFRKRYDYLWKLFLNGKIIFENFYCKKVLTKFLNNANV